MSSEAKPIKTINDYISHAMDMAERDERVKIVAWLRRQAQLTLFEATPDEIADKIENCEYRVEVE